MTRQPRRDDARRGKLRIGDDWNAISIIALSAIDAELVTVTAPAEPGLAQFAIDVRQGDVVCAAVRGLPGYTYEHAPGALWRSRHDSTRARIVINSGHRDFVFASRSKSLKLRYLGRLFVKELIQLNFPGASPAEALERMIELSLYVEENLR